MKKIGLILFVVTPIVLVAGINLAGPFISNEQVLGMDWLAEPQLKHFDFMRKPRVDTVICGDSRAQRMALTPFLKRHWAPFNWSLSGVDPVDAALQLNHALLYGDIKRVVLGVSFESMAMTKVFSYARYVQSVPFTDPRIGDLWGLKQELSPAHGIMNRLRQAKAITWFMCDAAKSRFRAMALYGIKQALHQEIPRLNDLYGNKEYQEIRRQIKAGAYDFVKNRDAQAYFDREDSEATFLKNKRLSAQAQRVYIRMFQELRARKIRTVLFETVKTPDYQRMIDTDPLLQQLNAQWREFFRKESYGGISFLEAKDIAGCYFMDDFFDAAHFIGERTENALAERLAAELDRPRPLDGRSRDDM